MAQNSADLRKLAAAARRHGQERPDNIVHARTCEAHWTRLAKKAEKAEKAEKAARES